MKMKRLLIMMSVIFLAGCQSNTSPTSSKPQNKKQYEGMNGLETYQAAVQYFNEKITYFKTESSDDGSHSYNEYFKMKDGIALVTKALYSDAESTTLNYNIANGKDYHTLFMFDSGSYKYNVVHDYTKKINTMYEDISKQDKTQIIDVKREEKDNQILLTLKVKKEQRYQESDQEDEIVYYQNQITLNKEGYISEEKVIYYTNDKFDEVSYEGLTTKYSDFNKRKSDDLNSEIQLIESCDGLNEEEVKEKINLQW